MRGQHQCYSGSASASSTRSFSHQVQACFSDYPPEGENVNFYVFYTICKACNDTTKILQSDFMTTSTSLSTCKRTTQGAYVVSPRRLDPTASTGNAHSNSRDQRETFAAEPTSRAYTFYYF